MSTGQQLGLIGSSVRVQSLPTASAATFGEGNRFYTLIGQQAGYITGHTYRTVMANDVYSWEDVRNELMLLALVDGIITADSSIEVALSNFNRQPLVDNLLIVYSNANQYALMKVSAVTSTAATLIVKDNSAANIVSTKGETGAAGVGITNAIAGEPIVADEKTTTPITFSFSDGTTKEFNVEAQNGTDGAQGIGVKSITSGTPTVVNDKTNTPITITLTDNTIVGLVVSAENGKDGTSATVDIVQATGQSTTAVMSQKAVTDELNKKANTSDIPIKTSQLTNDSDYATKSYLDAQDDKKLDKAGGSVTGNLAIGGNLIVNGSTTSIDSTTLKVSDKLIEVAKDNTVQLTTPAGIVVPKYDGKNYGALVIDGDGNAQVGDVKLDASGNIDVANSDLQTLATREGLTNGNLVKWDSTKKTLVPDTTVASNASLALSKANENATEISAIKTTYQTKTDNTLETNSKTVVGAINEVKDTADGANSKANVNATEISNIKNGTTVVPNADHANAAVNATNVTTNINGHAISSIFETNGTTVKEATHAGKATSADKATQANSASKVAKSLTFSGQNAQGTMSTIGFDGSQAQEVDFNGDDFVATNGNAFEVSLAPSGVTAGTYNNVTIDEKGRATAGSNKDYATTAQVKAKYTKPESGIPKSDLTVSVQTSLDKADTALQKAPVTSVNGKTGAVQLAASDVGALPTSTKYVVSVNGESGEVKNIAKINSANTFTGNQTVTGNGSVSGNFTVGGNLTINGTTTTVDSTTLQVKDKLIEVAHGNTTTLTTPAGLVAPKYDGTNSGALVFDSTGTAYVGDVKLKDGNIDVANSGLQPLATRTGLVGGNLVQYDSSALTLKDSGKKISDLATTAMLEDKQNKITSSNKLSSSLIDGLGAAAAKAVDTAISANSTSTNLPTSKAVEDRINAHSGIDKVGTVTGVKMNETTKNPSSGVVDLGTVLTDASKFATSAQGTKADNAMPKSGGTFTGNISLPKELIFTNETNPFIKMRTGGTDFYFQSAGGQFGLGPTWDKATHWDSNGNVTFPTTPKVGSSPLALKTDIPPKVTESTVSGWGFTKNKGTVTSVAVKMNGSTKGTITSSGTIDLGAVITDISGKLDKTTYEVNKTIAFGQDGVLYVGKFKVYDTNVTCEVTSTTNVTYSGKLVIATQNYVIAKMTVYGDAANTVAPNFFIKPSTTSDPYIEVYFKPASWSKNVVHIYGCRIEAEPTDVCTNVPSVPSTATLKPTNALPTYSLSGTTLTITL